MIKSLVKRVLPASAIGPLKRTVKHGLKPVVRRYAPKRVDFPLDLWRLERDESGALSLDGISLPRLLDQYGSPLHVVDAVRLDANIEDFLHVPPGAARGCEVYYSYKTNPIPAVLQRMHVRGIGAEVISAYELWLALRLGVAPSDIVYNGPAKSPESLRQALEAEIGLLNFNNREEIAPFAELARSLGKRPRVGVRVVVPGGWGGQFGASLGNGEAIRAFEEALACPELDVVALHVHRGSQISTAAELRGYVANVLAFADQLYSRFGLDLEIVDFGGSLACATTPHLSHRDVRLNTAFHTDLIPRDPATVLSIRDYVATIVSMVEDHYRSAGRTVPRIVLEPGRAMTANTQMLLCQVMMTKQGDENLTYAILDAGINIAESVRGEYHQLFRVGPDHAGPRRTYRLTGPICTPADVLYPACELSELRPGDALAIMDSGAYFVPFSTSFSFPQPAIVLVDHGKVSLIREAETFDHLIVLDRYESSVVLPPA